MSQKDKTIQTYKLVDKEIKCGTYKDQDIVDFNKSKVGKGKFDDLFIPFEVSNFASDVKNTSRFSENGVGQHLLPQINAGTSAYIIDSDKNGRNGLVIIPQALNNMQQIFWSYHCLTDLCQPSSCKSNLNHVNQSSKTDEFEANLFNKFVQNNVEEMKIINKKMLDLKWTTHGYHFDWDNRLYHDDNKSPFPPSLDQLASHIIRATFGTGKLPWSAKNEFRPEASIINYYSKNGRMGGHRDDVEPDQTSPVISISMCNDAIFLLGGTTKDIEPIPIRLHSGDIMIMSGSSRRAVHGVSVICPRTIKPSLLHGLVEYSTSHTLLDGSEKETELAKEKLLDYFSILRINVNVRQVFESCGAQAVRNFPQR